MRKRQARDEFERHLADIAEKIRKLREQDQKLSSLVEERHTSLQDARGKLASTLVAANSLPCLLHLASSHGDLPALYVLPRAS